MKFKSHGLISLVGLTACLHVKSSIFKFRTPPHLLSPALIGLLLLLLLLLLSLLLLLLLLLFSSSFLHGMFPFWV